MSLDKHRILKNSFFYSQFEYCPLARMFHSRALNNRINYLHYRALRLIYKEDSMSFQDLLNRDRSVTIHHRHIQKLDIEVYKAKNNLSPILIQEIFPERNYNGPDLRHQLISK